MSNRNLLFTISVFRNDDGGTVGKYTGRYHVWETPWWGEDATAFSPKEAAENALEMLMMDALKDKVEVR